jgi:hypothetical protein
VLFRADPSRNPEDAFKRNKITHKQNLGGLTGKTGESQWGLPG